MNEKFYGNYKFYKHEKLYKHRSFRKSQILEHLIQHYFSFNFPYKKIYEVRGITKYLTLFGLTINSHIK